MASRVLQTITRRAALYSPREPLQRLPSGFFPASRSPASFPITKFSFSSTAASQTAEKEHDSPVNTTKESMEHTEADLTAASKESKPRTNEKRTQAAKQTAFSDSDSDIDAADLSFDGLVKLVSEKEELLKIKHKELENMQDKVLRSYAETENILERAKREAENSKKFAIQAFAKSLLDVADNLGRATSVAKESFSKIDPSKDLSGAVPLLETLLEGVEMTEKQLLEVFKKFGMKKFDPINETFDPIRHHAVFPIPDSSKPPGTVAAVIKAGFMLHDRVLRPAEVGVTEPATESLDE